MHERSLPGGADDLRADDHVAELPRQARRQLVERVEREGERVGGLVDAEVLALQRAALLRPDKEEAEIARVDALGFEHLPRKRDGTRLVHLGAGAIFDLHLDHRRRSDPVSSECCL